MLSEQQNLSSNAITRIADALQVDSPFFIFSYEIEFRLSSVCIH